MSNEERRMSRQDEEKRNEILKENARELYAIFSVVCHNVTSRYSACCYIRGKPHSLSCSQF